MQAVGCRTLFSMNQLAVMGVSDVLKQLPRLLKLRRQLTTHFKRNPPSLFIGIDAPDF